MTDFNDLAAHNGLETVKVQLAGAKLAKPGPEGAQATPQDNGPGKRAVLRCMNDVQAMAIRWMWFGRIARGKLTLLVGPPGTAKSQLTAYMAATTTRGRSWPDGAGSFPGKVVILSAEDDPEDTIRPRLEAVDADLSKVFILEAIHDKDKHGRPVARSFKLSEDLAALDAELTETGGVVLVVVDPISAYLGAADSHNNAEVRALLSPLSELAAKHGAAVVAVSHLNKGAGSAIDRVTGSGAFVAAARASYLVCKDRDDQHRRLFLPMKNNLGNDSTGLAFRVEGVTLPSGIETSRIAWEADPVTITADDALAAQVNPAERGALAEAKAFLNETLKDGPKTARSIRGEVEDAGLSWATVRRAQLLLGIKPYKNAYQGKFMWALSSGGASNVAQSCSSSPAPKNMSVIGKNEHHWPTSEHHSINNNNNNQNSKMVREDQWCSSTPNDAHVAHGRGPEHHCDEPDYEDFLS
ncbi:MAG: AAA family ATPase [Magnetococcales bacterium]|nr:AAA family ATPase [Magnetococcales bacterium]